jgi:hypothetical protein
MNRPLILASLGLIGLGLAACEKDVQAPETRNVCYQVTPGKDQASTRFNPVAQNSRTMEACAAQLDLVRHRFMAMGSPRNEIVGAYNGSFLFIDSGGMRRADSLNGGRFVAYGRNAQGELIQPNGLPIQAPPEEAAPPPPPAKK